MSNKIEKNISLLVSANIRAQEIEDVIENTGGQLLWSTDMAAFYDGPDLGEAEKVSFTFRLIFQGKDHEITDKEADEIVTKIKTALESKGWEVKK